MRDRKLGVALAFPLVLAVISCTDQTQASGVEGSGELALKTEMVTEAIHGLQAEDELRPDFILSSGADADPGGERFEGEGKLVRSLASNLDVQVSPLDEGVGFQCDPDEGWRHCWIEPERHDVLFLHAVDVDPDVKEASVRVLRASEPWWFGERSYRAGRRFFHVTLHRSDAGGWDVSQVEPGYFLH